jgi:hypothetical protein
MLIAQWSVSFSASWIVSVLDLMRAKGPASAAVSATGKRGTTQQTGAGAAERRISQLSLFPRKCHPFANDFSARLVVFDVRDSLGCLFVTAWRVRASPTAASPFATGGLDYPYRYNSIRTHGAWIASRRAYIRPTSA